MSELKVNKVSPVTGTELTLGDSGDTIDLSTTTVTLPANSVNSDQYVDGSIDNEHLADDAVNSDELAAGAVDLAHMSATGTASSSTFLRGDNSWQEAGGGAWAVKENGAGTFSSTSILTITSITKTIKVYLSYAPSTGTSINMLTSTDGGTNWGGVPYYDLATITGQQGASTLTYDRTNNSGVFQLNAGAASSTSSATGTNVVVELTLHTPESNRAKIATWDVTYPTNVGQDDNYFYTVIGKGVWGGSTAINAVKFYPGSGTFVAGKYVVLELN